MVTSGLSILALFVVHRDRHFQQAIHHFLIFGWITPYFITWLAQVQMSVFGQSVSTLLCLAEVTTSNDCWANDCYHPHAHLEGEVVKRRGCAPFPLCQRPQMLHVCSGSFKNSKGCAALPDRYQQDPHRYVCNYYVIWKICRIPVF